PEAARRALPGDAVRASPLLPVRPRGGLARPRLWQRLARPLADDPPRLAAVAGDPRGPRAPPRVEAPLRLGRGANAPALLPRRALVAAFARGGAARAPFRRGGGRGGAAHPPGQRAQSLPALVRIVPRIVVRKGASMRGFKNFLMQGQLVVVAVGLSIALAFSTLVSAFTGAVITPLVNAAGGGGANGLGVRVNGELLDFGSLISAIIYFIVFVAVGYFPILLPYPPYPPERGGAGSP